MTRIELAAFRGFQIFIRNGVGTCKLVRDDEGNILGEEAPEMAALRRWEAAPQRTRDEFTAIALAMEPVLVEMEFAA